MTLRFNKVHKEVSTYVFNPIQNYQIYSLKYVDVKSVKTFDDAFYFNKMIVKQKVVWNIANVLLVPTLYYSVLSGNTKYGKGDLSVLNLMEGKPNKKKSKK